MNQTQQNAKTQTPPKKTKTYSPIADWAAGKYWPTKNVQTQQITQEMAKLFSYLLFRSIWCSASLNSNHRLIRIIDNKILTSATSTSRLFEEFSIPDPWNWSWSDGEAKDVSHNTNNRKIWNPWSSFKLIQNSNHCEATEDSVNRYIREINRKIDV